MVFKCYTTVQVTGCTCCDNRRWRLQISVLSCSGLQVLCSLDNILGYKWFVNRFPAVKSSSRRLSVFANQKGFLILSACPCLWALTCQIVWKKQLTYYKVNQFFCDWGSCCVTDYLSSVGLRHFTYSALKMYIKVRTVRLLFYWHKQLISIQFSVWSVWHPS